MPNTTCSLKKARRLRGCCTWVQAGSGRATLVEPWPVKLSRLSGAVRHCQGDCQASIKASVKIHCQHCQASIKPLSSDLDSGLTLCQGSVKPLSVDIAVKSVKAVRLSVDSLSDCQARAQDTRDRRRASRDDQRALPVEVRSRLDRQIPQRPFDYGDMNGPLRWPRFPWRWRPGTRCHGQGAPTGPAFAVLCGSVASSSLSQRGRDSSSPYIVPVAPGGWVPLQYCVA